MKAYWESEGKARPHTYTHTHTSISALRREEWLVSHYVHFTVGKDPPPPVSTHLLTYLLTYLLIYLITYLLTHSFTPWCRTLLEKLIVTQHVKKYPASFMEPEGSLPCSQKPATGPCPQPADPVPTFETFSLS
jgi:hypothetical protein